MSMSMTDASHPLIKPAPAPAPTVRDKHIHQRKQQQQQQQQQQREEKQHAHNGSTTTSTSHPFNIFRHLRDVFVRPEGGRMNALDGYRVWLCLWMFVFHGYVFLAPFSTVEHHTELSQHPSMLFITIGFVATDGFFVLTGFLLAYPLFSAEQKKPESSCSFSVSDFWYRRMTRMLPIYYIFMCMVAFGLFPNDVHFPRSTMYSSHFAYLLDRVTGTPGEDGGGLRYLMPINGILCNQLLPLGGAVPWTWSLAVQFQFYLWFPVLYARCRSARGTVRVLWYVLFVSIAFRVYGFFHMRAYHHQEQHGFILMFFFYANTLVRINAIILGVFAAYYSLSSSLLSHLRSSPILRTVLWISALVIIGANTIIIRRLQQGDVWMFPIRVSVEASQAMAPLAVTWDNLGSHMPYVHRVLYHAVMDVGGPLCGMCFVCVMLMSLHGIGRVGRALNRIMSWSVWYPISMTSYWIYLWHPAIFTKYYGYLALSSGASLPCDIPTVLSLMALVFVMVFVLSLLCHVLIERPLDLLLRSSTRRGWVEMVARYCKLLCGLSVLLHVIITGVLAWWLPTEAPPAQQVIYGQ